MPSNIQSKILIVGAGPTGLMMGILLAREGIPFRIIEQKTARAPHSRALAVQTRTLELLQDLHLLDQFMSGGQEMREVTFHTRKKQIGHFTLEGVASPYSFALIHPQERTEKILEKHLISRGIKVERGVALREISADGHVIIGEEKLHYQYILGCDGGHSFIRGKLQIPFVGSDRPELFALADLKVQGPIDPGAMSGFFAFDGIVGFIPMPEGYMRLVASNMKERKELDLSTLTKLVKQRSNRHFILSDIKWTSYFTTHFRHSATMRKNNIFLLGDAAHIHSPVGGQGMNTGLQDSYNLAWKLARVIRGEAKSELLETYEEERMQVAESLLRWTSQMTKLVTLQKNLFLFLRNTLLSYLFKRKFFQKKLRAWMTQTRINYRESSLSRENKPTFFSALFNRKRREFCLGPHAGDRALDAEITLLNEPAISTLYETLSGTKFVLLIFASKRLRPKLLTELREVIPQDFVTYLIASDEQHPLIEPWNGKVILDRTALLRKTYGVSHSSLYLIRPDNYIAYRSYGFDIPALKKFLRVSAFRE
ncbi:MAG: FAD-dependent monooxygenase [Chlamydiales bacterium]